MKTKIKLVLIASFCCLLWATAIPTLKISYSLLEIGSEDIFSRLMLAGMRFFLAGVLILFYVIIKDRKQIFVSRKYVPHILLFGIVNTSLQYLFFYTGVANTSAVESVLLEMLKPVFVVVLAHFLTKDDKMNLKKMLGIVLGFMGIFIANLEGMYSGAGFQITFWGEGALVLASVMNAIAVFYGRHLLKKMSSLTLNMYQFICGSLFLFVTGLIGVGSYDLKFSTNAILLLIYSAFLSAVAFVLWYSLLGKYKASSVTVHLFLIPVFGTMISTTIFPEENLTGYVLLSLLLVSSGIFIVNKDFSVKKLSKIS